MSKPPEEKKLIKEMYRLGYNVGYHKHLEMGRIIQRYNALVEKANKIGCENRAKSYYKRGKDAGGKKREKEITSGLGKSNFDKQKDIEKFDKITTNDDIKDGCNSKDKVTPKKYTYSPTKRPEAMSLPSSIERIETTELPSFLEPFHKSIKKEK